MMTASEFTEPTAFRHPTDTYTLERLAKGEVHIQTDPYGQSLAQHALYHLTDIWTERLEVGISTIVAQRERYRGDILQTPFHRHTHRTRIVGIHRGIVAVIDATHHHIGLTRTQLRQCHLHTVDRSACATPHLQSLGLLYQIETQGDSNRESTRRARTGRVRSTNNDIGQGAQHLREHTDALRLIAVVVGYQDQRSLRILIHFFLYHH